MTEAPFDESSIDRRLFLRGLGAASVAGTAVISGMASPTASARPDRPVQGGRGLIAGFLGGSLAKGDPFWLLSIPDGEEEPSDPVEVSCGNEPPRTRQPYTIVLPQGDGTVISFHDVVLLNPNRPIPTESLSPEPTYQVGAINPCSGGEYFKFVFRPNR